MLGVVVQAELSTLQGLSKAGFARIIKAMAWWMSEAKDVNMLGVVV